MGGKSRRSTVFSSSSEDENEVLPTGPATKRRRRISDSDEGPQCNRSAPSPTRGEPEKRPGNETDYVEEPSGDGGSTSATAGAPAGQSGTANGNPFPYLSELYEHVGTFRRQGNAHTSHTYKCKTCGNKLSAQASSKSNLKRHMRTCHKSLFPTYERLSAAGVHELSVQKGRVPPAEKSRECRPPLGSASAAANKLFTKELWTAPMSVPLQSVGCP